MANSKAKKASGSPSIVRHPLFPTIVAIWFAALFGLGSLAVRTSLLESLVIASKIDLIVPMTAPPLGITARILIAIAMTAIGSIIGFILALRLARPKPEIRQERVRTARAFGGSAHAANASPRYPQESEQAYDKGAVESDRRRSLIASNQDLGENPYHDDPGLIAGMPPHILDVTTFDVDPIDRPSAAPEQPHNGEPALELDQFATLAVQQAPDHGTFAAPAQDTGTGMAEEFQPMSPYRPIELAQPAIELQTDAEPKFRRPFEAPAEQGLQRFDPPSTPAPAEAQVQQFETPIERAQYQEFATEHGDAVVPQAFAAPVASPLQFAAQSFEIADAPTSASADDSQWHAERESFAEVAAAAIEADDSDPMAVLRNKIAPMPSFDSEPADSYRPEPVEAGMGGDFHADPVSPAEPACEPEVVRAFEPASQPVAAQWTPPLGAAAERLVNADLADLSPVELIERLALSLQRRGRAVSIAPPAQAPRFDPPAALPAAPEAIAPVVEAPRFDPPAVFAAEPEPAAPEADLPPQDSPEAAEPTMAAPVRIALPAALRPIDFTQYEQEDDLPSYVPARSIAMPSYSAETSAEEPSLQPQVQPVAEAEVPHPVAMPRFGRPPVTEEFAPQAEEDVLEAGYSSLLDMSKPAAPRQQFVRVADPEADTDAAEPVVIFPGQAMRAGTRFAAPAQGPVVTPSAPPPSLADTEGQPRRFDAPAASAARDPEETERALRSALATLQRMSGAA